MKYIKQDYFVNFKGEPQYINDEKASVGRVLQVAADSYVPRDDLVLKTAGEMRSRNKAVAVLEELPKHQGHFGFEDADFEILKKVVVGMAPYMKGLWFSLEEIEAVFDGALSELPEEATEGSKSPPDPAVNGNPVGARIPAAAVERDP